MQDTPTSTATHQRHVDVVHHVCTQPLPPPLPRRELFLVMLRGLVSTAPDADPRPVRMCGRPGCLPPRRDVLRERELRVRRRHVDSEAAPVVEAGGAPELVHRRRPGAPVLGAYSADRRWALQLRLGDRVLLLLLRAPQHRPGQPRDRHRPRAVAGPPRRARGGARGERDRARVGRSVARERPPSRGAGVVAGRGGVLGRNVGRATGVGV